MQHTSTRCLRDGKRVRLAHQIALLLWNVWMEKKGGYQERDEIEREIDENEAVHKISSTMLQPAKKKDGYV